jgi:hypothetical protein
MTKLHELTKEVNECLAEDLRTGTQNTFVTNVTKAVRLEHVVPKCEISVKVATGSDRSHCMCNKLIN